MFRTFVSLQSSPEECMSGALRTRTRSTSIGIEEPLATHHILSNSKNVHVLEIQQKGRTALWCQTSRPMIGSPILILTTPKVDGEAIVAAAKLKPSTGSCKVMLGDPSRIKQTWTPINSSSSSTSSSSELLSFTYEGHKYIWRKRPLIEPTNDEDDDMQQNDIELVTSNDRETVLAAYLPLRKAVSLEQIGRLDYMVDLGPKLELMCLAMVLAAHQMAVMMGGKKKRSAMRFQMMRLGDGVS